MAAPLRYTCVMCRVSRLSILAVLLWLCSPTAGAAFQAEPEAACAFLSDIGLNGRTYRRVGEDLYRCISRRRNLPFGGAQVHTMRYLAQGGPHNVRQLRLTLYINSRSQMQAALRRMLENGRLLLERALETNMPEEVVRRLLDGATGTWQVAGADVVLEKSQIQSSSQEYHLLIR